MKYAVLVFEILIWIILVTLSVLALKKKKAILIVPLVLVYLLSFGVDYYLSAKGYSFVQNITSIVHTVQSRKNTVYDKKGNAYENKKDLIFYDRQGGEYQFKGSELYTIVRLSDHCEFESNQCFVSGHGYFYYDADNDLKYNEASEYYYDGSGEVYYPIEQAQWNAYGYLTNNTIDKN